LFETIAHVRLFVHVFTVVVELLDESDDPPPLELPQPELPHPAPQPEFVCFMVSLIVAKYDRRSV
jgi:hypothetical protein